MGVPGCGSVSQPRLRRPLKGSCLGLPTPPAAGAHLETLTRPRGRPLSCPQAFVCAGSRREGGLCG